MAINPNQLSVAKIYPGNYINVLRYWHETKDVDFRNRNGDAGTFTDQPVGGPVGVVFRPGWIAQQAVGYVDLSYQANGSINQLEYYTQPYTSGTPFTEANVIIPSPDFHKDIRADIADGIKAPAGAIPYRSSIRLDGGDVVSSGVAGGQAAPQIGLGVAANGSVPSVPTAGSGFFAILTGSDARIENGSTTSTNIINSSVLSTLTEETTYKLFAVQTETPSGGSVPVVVEGSGVYDARTLGGSLSGRDKALAICEVCWIIPDEPPERGDLALQPAGLIESNVFTSTTPRA